MNEATITETSERSRLRRSEYAGVTNLRILQKVAKNFDHLRGHIAENQRYERLYTLASSYSVPRPQ
ncbi:hypothetical protein [Bradyrhizobium sp. 23AC]